MFYLIEKSSVERRETSIFECDGMNDAVKHAEELHELIDSDCRTYMSKTFARFNVVDAQISIRELDYGLEILRYNKFLLNPSKENFLRLINDAPIIDLN